MCEYGNNQFSFEFLNGTITTTCMTSYYVTDSSHFLNKFFSSPFCITVLKQIYRYTIYAFLLSCIKKLYYKHKNL